MKRTIYGLILAAAVVALAAASPIRSATTGLVAAYGFDEGTGTVLHDTSGNHNDGAIVNGAWTSGRFGKALTFNGSSSRVNISSSASLTPTGAVTVEAWVRPTSVSGWKTVALKEQTSTNLSYGLYAGSDTGPAAVVYTKSETDTKSSTKLPLSTWTHIASVYTGTSDLLYVNGSLAAQRSASGSIAETQRALRIGGNTIWNEWFQGQIDELRIYNRALSAAEVQRDMTVAVTAAQAETQAPSVPGSFVSSGVSQTSIAVSWVGSSDNVGVAGYGLYRNGVLVGSAASTSYSFSGLACGTSYSLAVDAFDAAGNRSAKASLTAATAACADVLAPSVPGSFVSSGVSQTSIAVSWAGSSDNVGVAGYGVYRNGALLGSSAGLSYSFGGLSCGTSYTLAVDAFDAAGNRSAKASLTAATAACSDVQAPSVPGSLAAGASSQTSITVSWANSTDDVGVTGYGVYRNGSLVGTSVALSYIVSGLSCGTSYSLAVDAVDAAGNRSAPASISAATAACADAQAPSVPGSFAAGAAGQTSVPVSWAAASDNVGVVGYGLYRDGGLVGSTGSLSYAFAGLSCGTSYVLAVDAVDAAGNRSGKASLSVAPAACALPPPAGQANLWVDTSGGSCARQATAAAYADAAACGSFQAAYAAAQCGDTVGVRAGSYGAQSISSGSKSCSASSQVSFSSVPGGACTDNTAVSMPSFSLSVAYVKLECMNANPAGTTSCADISGSSGQHGSIVWNTLDNMAIHCAFFDSDHLRVTNTVFGPDNTCQTGLEDLVDFRANTDNINDVVFDHVTFATVTAPPDFQCGVGKHVDSMQGYGIANLVISHSLFYGCPGQCIIFRPYNGGTPGPITIQNTIFNQPQDPGQAIDIGSSTSADGDRCNGPILIQNNTFVNGAAVHGGCWNNPSIIFRNNIMSGSSCNFGGSGDLYSYNVFYSGSSCGSSLKTCTPSYLAGSTSLTLPGNYHLAATDTCAHGAGDVSAGTYASDDMDGDTRPLGGTVDIGADEIP